MPPGSPRIWLVAFLIVLGAATLAGEGTLARLLSGSADLTGIVSLVFVVVVSVLVYRSVAGTSRG